ncbi:hypothetical protein REJC140_00117 [Pseudorhizobium endolithicum]|uniref:Uncharacterized protein n=1 Tax=Pseudorhizobium endolithicum TaxID=1191678 RepID=A0ABN7JCP6_9HYPH|nr:DUF2188 domain-containing protein [Pseudorhizobium endolithicum]CAD7023172.1 hypothetical protein REJC140_00117 [Pseudorhizobium endolithicum]
MAMNFRPAAFHAVPHRSAWAVRRSGADCVLVAGLRREAAIAEAIRRADEIDALAYIHDGTGRVETVHAANPDVVSVNVALRQAVTDTGKRCEITNLFDEEGDETDDASAAVAAVAKLADDRWLSVDLTAFVGTGVN